MNIYAFSMVECIFATSKTYIYIHTHTYIHTYDIYA
jgi:hypothetical protein